MKITTINMGNLNDKSKPFSSAVWREPSQEEEKRFIEMLSESGLKNIEEKLTLLPEETPNNNKSNNKE